MIPEVVGFRKNASHKHKVLRTIQYFWMTSSFRRCVDVGCRDVVNRGGGMIPEVVSVPRG